MRLCQVNMRYVALNLIQEDVLKQVFTKPPLFLSGQIGYFHMPFSSNIFPGFLLPSLDMYMVP